ncbi:MAG TPA: Na+/H+ antiporter NhaA [Pseudomonadales bacterium]
MDSLRQFFRLEAAGGILLVAAAMLALVISNSPLDGLYEAFLDVPVVVQVGALKIAKPLVLWINDGLMAMFFFTVGLEVKREMLEGELSSRDQILLPAAAAFGGFVVPALIYWFINAGDPLGNDGWAIPAATDIAFALGVLALLGSRVPLSLKVFLVSLAIFDDLAAIVVIALFYTEQLSVLSLSLALVGVAGLSVLKWRRVVQIGPYMMIGVFIWVCVLKSGVHATLAGVVTALFIPMRNPSEAYEGSPLKHLEHVLHPWVAFMILPLFAFVNAGVSFAGMTTEMLTGGVALGVAVGLFLGKQLGVFLTCVVLIRLGLARLPKESSWWSLYGVSVLTGIGFTMSLFIGSLAFESAGYGYHAGVRAGVLVGSMLSAVLGYLVLRLSLEKAHCPKEGSA